MNGTDLFYRSDIFFHCGKTLGVPVLVNDYTKSPHKNILKSELLGPGELDECSFVFEWSTNQVCSAKRLRQHKEIPCYLTLTDKEHEKNVQSLYNLNTPLLNVSYIFLKISSLYVKFWTIASMSLLFP